MIDIIKKLIFKFQNAVSGLVTALKEESSIVIEMFVSVIIIIIAIIFRFQYYEWIIIILCITLVLGLELINTSIENLLDFISFKYDVKIKKIKDLIAAGIFIISGGFSLVGAIIIIHAIIHYVNVH